MHRNLFIRWLDCYVFANLRFNLILNDGSAWLSIEVVVAAALHPRVWLDIWRVYLLYFQGALVHLIRDRNMCNFLIDDVHIWVFTNRRAFSLTLVLPFVNKEKLAAPCILLNLNNFVILRHSVHRSLSPGVSFDLNGFQNIVDLS